MTFDEFSFLHRTIMMHGFTVDESGKKMSKSIGNVVSPSEIIYGNKVSTVVSPLKSSMGIRLARSSPL